MSQPKRKLSPYRDIDITDDDVNVVQSRRFPLNIKPRRDDLRYTVRVGDTLMKLADTFLGDPLNWWFIMDRNEIEFPLEIEPGQVIFIPSITTMNTETRRR